MIALELVRDRDDQGAGARAASAAVRPRATAGLILLSCGLYGNVVRVLVPLVIADEDLSRGLEILEESLVAARSGAA